MKRGARMQRSSPLRQAASRTMKKRGIGNEALISEAVKATIKEALVLKPVEGVPIILCKLHRFFVLYNGKTKRVTCKTDKTALRCVLECVVNCDQAVDVSNLSPVERSGFVLVARQLLGVRQCKVQLSTIKLH